MAQSQPVNPSGSQPAAAKHTEHSEATEHTDETAAVVGLADAEAPEAEPTYEATGTASTSPFHRESFEPGATSVVSRADMDRRQSRSAPDALRWEPGVAIQQTSHAQASPYVRGMTGQQVVHVFDGVRLNTAVYRQGPNQYFFTVDEASVASLRVMRGAASVRYGSDALGGVLQAEPLRAHLGEVDGIQWRPRLRLRYGSADRELGGRAQVQARWDDAALQVGLGYRDVSQLRSGGVVQHRQPVGESGRGAIAPWVLRFTEEGSAPVHEWRTQLGTGFREATFDGRYDQQVHEDLRAFAAVYGYRQMDAPRSDQCPAPEAPVEECLAVERQWRTLAYAGLRGAPGKLEDFSLTVSYQRHAERRRRDRPRSGSRFRWDDNVDSLGIAFHAASPLRNPYPRVALAYGADAYRDDVSSSGERAFTDVDPERVFTLSRGQYLSDSHQVSIGAFTELRVDPAAWLHLSVGGRGSLIEVAAPGDPESGTSALDRTFRAAVGRGSVTVDATDSMELLYNANQGFRAPNLDDLTARQQVGPGFQFENAGLEPERSLTQELGVRTKYERIELEVWAFATLLWDGIQRVVREARECPPSSPECLGSRDPFQLVNARACSRIFGGEVATNVWLPRQVVLRATLSYAWGDGPSLGDSAGGARVPLSRIPPLQGTLEGRWRHRPSGIWIGAGLRWALAQGRLAVSDASDPRIPVGGTPGYGVVELRAGWRYRDWLQLSVIGENLGGAAYKVHGSSVLGAGPGVRLTLEVGRR